MLSMVKQNRILTVSIFLVTNLLISSIGNSDRWQVQHLGPGAGTAIQIGVIDPVNEDIFYIGGDSSGVLRTLDGGQTWDEPNAGLLTPSDAFYALILFLSWR